MKYDILLPIKPYYAYLIMKGEKTVEVRKFYITVPNWSGKFKVYVSKDKTSLKRIPEADRAEFEKYLGKVAFEFVKGGVMCEEALHMRHGLKDSCLTHEELYNYGKCKPLYGYRVTALKIYDKPKELSEFRGYCNKKEKCYKDIVRHCNDTHFDWKCNSITRPPQSWQYVGEIEE